MKAPQDAPARLRETVRQIFTGNKGIMATDESPGTIGKKLQALGIESTEQNRIRFRHLLYSCPGIEKYLSGVIINEEAISQRGPDGRPLLEPLLDRGLEVGVKLDGGLCDQVYERGNGGNGGNDIEYNGGEYNGDEYNGTEHGTKEEPDTGHDDYTHINGSKAINTDISTPPEKKCLGIEAVPSKLADPRLLSVASFAKWRALFHIGPGTPSPQCVRENVSILCRFALLCQRVGIVPIVEPELALEGAYKPEEMRRVGEAVYRELARALEQSGVEQEGVIWKVSFVSSGENASIKGTQATTREKGHRDSGQNGLPNGKRDPGSGAQEPTNGQLNVDLLSAGIPSQTGGVVFLSGGHSMADALERLADVKRLKGPVPISFSFARAITNGVLEAWGGRDENVGRAQGVLLETLASCSEANGGNYRKCDSSGL